MLACFLSVQPLDDSTSTSEARHRNNTAKQFKHQENKVEAWRQVRRQSPVPDQGWGMAVPGCKPYLNTPSSISSDEGQW